MTLIQQLYAHLQDIQEKEIPIIVEGWNDKKALQALGLTNIFTLNMPLFKIVERIPGREVVILTDLDTKGKQLYARIQHDCIHHGIRINNRLRHFLFRETPLSHIEGLPTYLMNLEKKEMGPKGLSGIFFQCSVVGFTPAVYYIFVKMLSNP